MKATPQEQQAKECFDRLPQADQKVWLDFTRRLQEAQRERLKAEQEANQDGSSDE